MRSSEVLNVNGICVMSIFVGSILLSISGASDGNIVFVYTRMMIYQIVGFETLIGATMNYGGFKWHSLFVF